MERRDDVCFKMPDIEAPRFIDEVSEFDMSAPKPPAALAGDYDVAILEQDFRTEILVFGGVKGQPAKNQVNAALTQVAGLQWNGRGLRDRKRKPRISWRQQHNNS